MTTARAIGEFDRLPAARPAARPGSSCSRTRQTDGRRLRGERTRQLIVEAYLALLSETPQIPTAAQIAGRAGYSTRSVFERFSNLSALTIAAADFALAQVQSEAVARHDDIDRRTRIKSQVGARIRTCERWMPLWRVAIANQSASAEIKAWVAHVREVTLETLKRMYRPEFLSLPELERGQLLIPLGVLMDFDSWGLMREGHHLSVKAAHDVWIHAIDCMLPPTPQPA